MITKKETGIGDDLFPLPRKMSLTAGKSCGEPTRLPDHSCWHPQLFGRAPFVKAMGFLRIAETAECSAGYATILMVKHPRA